MSRGGPKQETAARFTTPIHQTAAGSRSGRTRHAAPQRQLAAPVAPITVQFYTRSSRLSKSWYATVVGTSVVTKGVASL